MRNMIGRTTLYTKLAAAARAEEAAKTGENMVDFKALREKAAQERKEKQTPALEKPIQEQQETEERSAREILLDNLEELIHSNEPTQWELNFCKSVKSWILKSPTNYMSIKQKAIYDRLVKEILEAPDTTSKIPTRDNRFPDGEYRPPYENRNSFPRSRYPHESVGDDMDDDVPF